MAGNTFHQIVLHIVWATKQRMPFITDEMRPALIQCITEEAQKRFAVVLACNTMPDHVHLLVSLPPAVQIASFIGQVKGAVSRILSLQFGPEVYLKWQEGYGVVSLRKADIPTVVRYIEQQQTRHSIQKLWPALENIGEQSSTNDNEDLGV